MSCLPIILLLAGLRGRLHLSSSLSIASWHIAFRRSKNYHTAAFVLSCLEKKKKKAFHCLYQTVSLIPIQEVQERDLFDTVGTTFMVRWLTRLILKMKKRKSAQCSVIIEEILLTQYAGVTFIGILYFEMMKVVGYWFIDFMYVLLISRDQ